MNTSLSVALLAEGVDRNLQSLPMSGTARNVALLAEGVDRNSISLRPAVKALHVALLAEGVDRNIKGQAAFIQRRESPSSQRAWIEILMSGSSTMASAVALLAEGVDRNSLRPLW